MEQFPHGALFRQGVSWGISASVGPRTWRLGRIGNHLISDILQPGRHGARATFGRILRPPVPTFSLCLLKRRKWTVREFQPGRQLSWRGEQCERLRSSGNVRENEGLAARTRRPSDDGSARFAAKRRGTIAHGQSRPGHQQTVSRELLVRRFARNALSQDQSPAV